jgi:hypothetical protein
MSLLQLVALYVSLGRVTRRPVGADESAATCCVVCVSLRSVTRRPVGADESAATMFAALITQPRIRQRTRGCNFSGQGHHGSLAGFPVELHSLSKIFLVLDSRPRDDVDAAVCAEFGCL